MAFAVAYLVVVVAGLTVVVRRRTITVWSVAGGACAIYGLPVALGIDAFGKDLMPLVSLTMLGVTLLMFLIEVIAPPQPAPKALATATSLNAITVVAATAVFAMVVGVHGVRIFTVHKLESGIGGGTYILWRLSASYALVVSVIVRRYWIALLPLAYLVATFFAGDRTGIGLALVAVVWIVAARVPNRNWFRFLAAVATGVVTVLFGKVFQAIWITSGGLADLVDVLRSTRAQLVATEPFVVIATFNRIVEVRLLAPFELLWHVVGQALPVPSYWGFRSTAFNDYYQPLLFPEFRERSLAYSFWGEGYAYFGAGGLLVCVVIYVGGIIACSRAAAAESVLVRGCAYLCGAYWMFYIHRNSLASILTYERHILLYVAAVAVMSIGVTRVRWSARQ